MGSTCQGKKIKQLYLKRLIIDVSAPHQMMVIIIIIMTFSYTEAMWMNLMVLSVVLRVFFIIK